MPRNGAGVYTLPAGNPVVTETVASSTVQNNTMSDVATALTNSLASNGETTPTGNLPMGGYKHTNVANSSSATDYAVTGQIQNGSYTTLLSVAGTNTITASTSPNLSGYVSGQLFTFIPAVTNTGAATININSVAAKDLKKNSAAGYVALAANDLIAGNIYVIRYDDTGTDQFVVLNPGIPNLSALVSAGLLDISGAAAGQIKFPASQNASANANTLDDYEENTWTPTDGSGAGLSLTTTSATYTKIGRSVLLVFDITYPANADINSAVIDGLPFTVASNSGCGAGSSTQGDLSFTAIVGTTTMQLNNSSNGTQYSNANMSTDRFVCCLSYITST